MGDATGVMAGTDAPTQPPASHRLADTAVQGRPKGH
jgi:hypothetical protein